MTEIPSNNDQETSETDKLDKTKTLVTNIFKRINNNQSIDQAAKSIILKLGKHYLKIAIDTPNLFAFESHQARILLDNICRLSIEWNEVEDSNNRFLKSLDNIVNIINGKEEYNNKEFIQFQHDLEKSLSKIKKRAVIIQKRKQEKQLAQEKISSAQKEASRIITKKVSAIKKLPDFIGNLLQHEWTNVLVLLHIRHGIESNEYLSKLELIDKLLNVISNFKSIDSLDQKYNDILVIYHKGLSLVAFNPQEIKDKEIDLLRNIKNITQPIKEIIKPKELKKLPQNSKVTADQGHIHMRVHDMSNKLENNSVSKTIEPAKNTDKTISKPQIKKSEFQILKKQKSNKPIHTSTKEKKNREKTDYSKIVSSLNKGSWFELMNKEGDKVKAKLSWVSPISGNHLFVDLSGLKIANKNKAELIEGLKDKSIKIISNS